MPDKPIDILRKNIRDLLDKQGWSQSDLCRQVNWAPPRLTRYLKDQEPGLDKIHQIAKAFGVEFTDLFKSNVKLKPWVETREVKVEVVKKTVKEEVKEAIRDAVQLAPWEKEVLFLLSTLNETERGIQIDALRRLYLSVKGSRLSNKKESS